MKYLRLSGGEYSDSWEETWLVPDDFSYVTLAAAVEAKWQALGRPDFDERHQIVAGVLRDLGCTTITSDFEVDLGYMDMPTMTRWLRQLRAEKRGV